MSVNKLHSQTNITINDKSQGSVATNLRCGKIFNSRVVANLSLSQVENVRWCGRRLLDGHAGSAIKVLVAIHYSVLDARNGYIRNVVV